MQKHKKGTVPEQDQNPVSASKNDKVPKQGSGSASIPTHPKPIQTAISELKPGPDTIMMRGATTTYIHNGRTVNVGILRTCNDKVNFLDAHRLVKDFNLQHNTNVKLITPHLADAMLNDGLGTWRFFQDNNCHSFFTNAFIAYAAKGARLGKKISIFSKKNPVVSLPSTGGHAGSKGIALFVSDVTSHDLQISSSGIILDIPDSRIQVVGSFPSENGYYTPDPATTVPHGNDVEYSSSARYLYRLRGGCVSPVARDCYYGDEDMQDIYTTCSPSVLLGVAVEYE